MVPYPWIKLNASISYDPVIWEHPFDVTQSIRSRYCGNNMYHQKGGNIQKVVCIYMGRVLTKGTLRPVLIVCNLNILKNRSIISKSFNDLPYIITEICVKFL